MAVLDDALNQNCTNGWALPNKMTARAANRKFLKQHLNHLSKFIFLHVIS